MQVETVVQRDIVAEALVGYTAESGVGNLVLGSATLNWFRSVSGLSGYWIYFKMQYICQDWRIQTADKR